MYFISYQGNLLSAKHYLQPCTNLFLTCASWYQLFHSSGYPVALQDFACEADRTRWIFHLASTQLPKELAVWYLHNLRMRSSGLLVIFLGKSIFSMPFRMKVYVIIWSLPENGGLVGKEEKHGKVIPPALIYRTDGVLWWLQLISHMHWKSWGTVGSDLPVRSSNTRIPRDQKSTLKLWPLLRMISGATYSGVPQNVQVFWPHLIFLAKPKSTWEHSTHLQHPKICTVADVAPTFLVSSRDHQPATATHQFDVAFSVQHQILGLQVSVEDTFTMEVIKSLGDAADTEFGCGFFKTSPEIKTNVSVWPSEATDAVGGGFSYLSLSRLHTSPPRQASSSM